MQEVLDNIQPALVLTGDWPRIHGPGLVTNDRPMSAFKFVDLDNPDDRIFGIADGSIYPFPDRDDQHTQKLDKAHME